MTQLKSDRMLDDEPPERSTLGHTGHPPADRGGSEAGCYS